MKGVVLEIRDGRAAVLMEDGSVITTEQKCSVGQTIEIDLRREHKNALKKENRDAGRKGNRILRFSGSGSRWSGALSAAAAAFVIIAAAGTYYTVQVQAHAYVTMDVNPSIEFVLNRRNRVVKAAALNSDAEEIVNQLQSRIRGVNLTEALNDTADLLVEAGYLQDDTDTVLLSVSADSEDTIQTLEEAVGSSVLCDSEAESSLDVVITATDLKTQQDASDQKISTGRYIAAGYGSCYGTMVYQDGILTADDIQIPQDDADVRVSLDKARTMQVSDMVSQQIEAAGEQDQLQSGSQSDSKTGSQTDSKDTKNQPGTEQGQDESGQGLLSSDQSQNDSEKEQSASGQEQSQENPGQSQPSSDQGQDDGSEQAQSAVSQDLNENPSETGQPAPAQNETVQDEPVSGQSGSESTEDLQQQVSGYEVAEPGQGVSPSEQISGDQ